MKTTRAAYLALFLIASVSYTAGAADYRIELRQGTWELKPGLATTVWSYGATVPGTPIITNVGERVKIEIVNNLAEATNVHWHGLVVPNDQDGPSITIEPGASHRYDFVAEAAGTYWYHPHSRPVLPQLDRGLYGAFIVRAPEDAGYSGDHVYVLDDWYLDARGRRIEGIAPGAMERIGNVDTVNGKTESAIGALEMRKGELHKLRFINASTAAVHTLRVRGHRFRVTHTDGHPLGEAYETDTIILAPGERIDAEIAARGSPGELYEIIDPNRDFGLEIPIRYLQGSVPEVRSPFVAPPPRSIDAGSSPDFVLRFGTAMGMMGGGGMGMMGGMGMHGGASAQNPGGMRWTINGRSFPDTVPIEVKAGEAVRMRFVNNDMTAMMGHPMDHPIHVHGTAFRIVSENGRPPKRETWKDTVAVPVGEYVDVEFVMKYPGEWMLHCHVIDHEDGGMLTALVVR